MATEISRIASITDYAMARGISTNISSWPRSVQEGYFRWAQQQMGEFNPADMQSYVSSEMSSIDSVRTGSDFVMVRNQHSDVQSDWSGRSTVDRIIEENEGGVERSGWVDYENQVPEQSFNQESVGNPFAESEATGTIVPDFGTGPTGPASIAAASEATGTFVPEFGSGPRSAGVAASEATGTIVPEFGSGPTGPTGAASAGVGTEGTGTIIPDFAGPSLPPVPIDRGPGNFGTEGTSAPTGTEAGSRGQITETGISDSVGPMPEVVETVATTEAPSAPSMVPEGGAPPPKAQWRMAEARSPEMFAELDALPDVPEFPSEMMSKFNVSEFKTVLNDSFMGVDSGGRAMFSVEGLQSSIMGAGVGLALIPLQNWLNSLGPGGQAVATGINALGMLGMVFGDTDPIGLAINAAIFMGNAFADRLKRKQANNYAGRTADSRLMMVKDQGKWYPAILKDKKEGEGLFAGSNQIEVAYGRPEDLTFVLEDGVFRGHFAHQKNRSFRMEPDEWTGYNGTKDFAEKKDVMKQWYFLSPEESTKIMSSYGTAEFDWPVYEEAQSSPFLNSMMELQKSLDLIQNAERKTSDPSTFLTSKSKGLHAALYKQFTEHDLGAWTSAEDGVDMVDSELFPKSWEKYGYNTEWDSYGGAGKNNIEMMFEFNRQVLPDMLRTLEVTRRAAAFETGVDDQTYLDNHKKIPYANNYDELRDQYNTISAYTDRTPLQKQYLKQKAAARYMIKFSDNMGYGADLYDIIQAHHTREQKIEGYKTKEGIMYWRGYKGEGRDDPKFMQNVPAWTNFGENAFPSWMRLADWQRSEEDHYLESIRLFGDLNIGESTIAYKGEQYVKNHPPVQDKAPLPPIVDALPQTKPPVVPVVGTVAGIVTDWIDRATKVLHSRVRTSFVPEVHHADTYLSGPLKGQKITIQNFKSQMATGNFDPQSVGEHSVTNVIDNLVSNRYGWAQNITLDATIIPTSYIAGLENTWKPLTEHLDNSSADVKQRASYMRNVVYAQQREDYRLQYHPEDPPLGHDSAPAFDDWTVNKEHQNITTVDGQQHAQMDLGYVDEI